MYCVFLVLLDYELYIVHGSVNLVVASLKPPTLIVRMNSLRAKKNVLVLCMSRINVICFHFCFGKPNK